MTIRERFFNNFKYFHYFYSRLGIRMVVALVLSLLVGVLDGFGLAMFLPLLEMVDGSNTASADGLGQLSFLIHFLESLGLMISLQVVLVTLLIFFLAKGVAKFIDTYYKLLIQQHFIKSLRLQLVKLLKNYSYEAFVLSDVGRIQNTLSGETGRVTGAYRAYFSTLQSAVLLFVYVILAFLANPQFALLVSAGGFLSNFLFKFVYRKTVEISKKITVDSNSFQGLLIQMVSFFKYLTATGSINKFAQKLSDSIHEIEDGNKKAGFYGSILLSVREPLSITVVVSVILVQVRVFDQDLGLIILSLLFFYRALSYVINMQTEWNKFLNVSGSLENMTAFTEDLASKQISNGDIEFSSFQKIIELKGVNFYFEKHHVLRNINFQIQKQETIAFIGESGAGKTTLVNLIAGLMKLSHGNILIDDMDIKLLDIKSFQKRIGYITQEPIIFNDSIYNNVTLWDDYSEENLKRFWYALEKAAIDEYVQALSLKEEEILGHSGLNLSGGQKQRISIARELYKEIDILILDEATSALDSETERLIQGNIEKLKGHYTILIVAHRLSTIKGADKVVIMENGEILAIDSYERLATENTKFKRMLDLQEIKVSHNH